MTRSARRRRLVPLLRALALVALGAAAAPAAAQSPPPRPDTGRHAPPPPPPSPSRQAVTVPWRESGRWSVAIGPGLSSSGDLFRVVVPGGGTPHWTPPAGGNGFDASEFLVTLDEDLAIGGALGFRIHPRWLARLDLSWAQVDATAEARVGQTVELHQWERLSFVSGGLGAECQLVHARAYPYALAGVAATRLSAVSASALDQTRLGLRAGVGFHYALGPAWGARAELRGTRQQFDLGRYGRDPAFAGRTFEELGPQTVFEILFQVRGLF